MTDSFESNALRSAIVAALLRNNTSSQGTTGIFGTLAPNAPDRAHRELLFDWPSTPTPLFPPASTIKPKVRRTFFSFHYADIMRVNNVRNAMEFQKGVVGLGFYDGSLWESRKRTNPESLKDLIREGMHRSSVLCVLYGSQTWARPWVRYEIARSIVDGMGVIAVDINGIAHHVDRVPHRRGPNPLDYMAVGRMRDGTFRIFEYDGGWVPYEDYRLSVTLPRYLPAPAVDYVTPLSWGAFSHDYQAENGSKNIGCWLDVAAARAGRA